MSENFKCFSSCIVDDIVFGHFDAVLAKARKFAKPEAKAIVDDLDAKLQAALSDEVLAIGLSPMAGWACQGLLPKAWVTELEKAFSAPGCRVGLVVVWRG